MWRGTTQFMIPPSLPAHVHVRVRVRMRVQAQPVEGGPSVVGPAVAGAPPSEPAVVVPVAVWTSTLRRTIATARYLPFPKLRWKALDEIHAVRPWRHACMHASPIPTASAWGNSP